MQSRTKAEEDRLLKRVAKEVGTSLARGVGLEDAAAILVGVAARFLEEAEGPVMAGAFLMQTGAGMAEAEAEARAARNGKAEAGAFYVRLGQRMIGESLGVAPIMRRDGA